MSSQSPPVISWRYTRLIGLILLLAATAGLIGLLVWRSQSNTAPNQHDLILPDVSATIDTLPKQTIDHPANKLADHDQPIPTNSWLSSLALDANDAPAYLYPWTYQPTGDGASLSYPDVTVGEQTITAGHTPDLKLHIDDSTAYQLASYDDVSAELTYRSDSETLARVRLVQGSPYIFVTVEPRQKLTLRTDGSVSSSQDNLIIRIGDKRYGVWSGDGLSTNQTTAGLTAMAGDQPAKLTLVTLPDSLDQATAFNLAGHQVVSTSVSYHVANDKVTTTYQLNTVNGKPTLYGLLPHQAKHSDASSPAGTIDMLLGSQTIYKGTTFDYQLTGAVPDNQLIGDHLTPDDRRQLVDLLQRDIDATTFDAADTYAAGKQLYRAANLLQLAHELDQPELADTIGRKLRIELMTWFQVGDQRDSKYFYYDQTIRGIVGVKSSFGSEQFNDHQFHYGYFIYAASVLAKYDADFRRSAAPMVTVLIRDIASPQRTEHFPKLRTYDSYAGHSWADGYGDTLDGNNQESSSEAVNAAYAIYLWSRATDNQALQKFGHWLYTTQAQTARYYWTNILPRAGYQPSIVSLVWQGKLDYGTFFSDEASAKLGIQLIPMSPGQQYLGVDRQRIIKNLAAVDKRSALGDYILMYQALADPQAAAARLKSFDHAAIDSADSLTYLTAWVLTHQSS